MKVEYSKGMGGGAEIEFVKNGYFSRLSQIRDRLPQQLYVLFVFSLAHHVVARAQIKNLSQYYVKQWKPLFPQGKLVRGKVLR